MKSKILKCVLLTGLMAAMTCTSFAQWNTKDRLVSVSADAEIKVDPDKAVIILGIETLDSILTQSKNKNDEMIKKLSEVASGYEISSTELQTDFISIAPSYSSITDKNGNKIFLGYLVRRRLVVTLTKISSFEALMTDFVNSGVDRVMSVQFYTTELRKYRDQVRILAIKAAYDKAQLLTGELGQKIKRPHSIQETGANYYSWYGGWDYWGDYYNRSSGYASQNSFETNTNSTDTPTAVGKISVKASVAVTFELQ